MKVTLLAITQDAEKLIELAGRTCYQSFDKITDESAGKFIKAILNKRHETPIEMGHAVFKIEEVSRALSHQLVRHRLHSFNQQSQRYVSEISFQYVIPPTIQENEEALNIFYDTMQFLQQSYDKLVKLGIPKEDARYVLPNACYTELVAGANFRQWRQFLKLRTDKHAQWEIRNMANEILKILKQNCPNVFHDFE